LSLLISWDIFTELYIRILEGQDPEKLNDKKKMSLQMFIGVIKMEYLKRKDQIDEMYVAKTSSSRKHPLSFLYQIGASVASPLNEAGPSNICGPTTKSQLKCTHCNGKFHLAKDCYFKDMTHCKNCNRFHCGQYLKKNGNSKFEKKQKKRDAKEDWKGKKKV